MPFRPTLGRLAAFMAASLLLFTPVRSTADGLPPGFVELSSVAPSIVQEMRYFGDHNFVGQKVDGYQACKCVLTQEAGQALARVQQDLRALGLSLKVYDCYRPQRAVNHFVRWARDQGDTAAKQEFYPGIDKGRLFASGYIASRSGHSRGSTVDLTIIPYPPPPQEEYIAGQELKDCALPAGRRFGDNSLDMGTGFDCFAEASHTASPLIGPQARANRLLLKTLMEKHGFVNYSKEWWHYTLRNEPFPETYFDFEIE